MSNQLQEYKVYRGRLEPILTLLALFLPMPIGAGEYTPDYIVNGWGFSYCIALTRWKIPLGWIIILISVVTNLIM